jgi:hypothetical protein
MLLDGESILLNAECSVYRRRWPFPQLGAGRAFLTGSRLIWIRRWVALPADLLRRLSIPDVIVVPLSEIDLLRRERWGLNSFLVRIGSKGNEYYYRFGRGPYPLLRRNPEISEEWFNRLQAYAKIEGAV